MNRVEHENQNMSNKLKEAKQVVRKFEKPIARICRTQLVQMENPQQSKASPS